MYVCGFLARMMSAGYDNNINMITAREGVRIG